MGKIRTKIIGSEKEEIQKKKDKARREGKKAQKRGKAPGLKGGERIAIVETPLDEVSVPTPDEITLSETKEKKAQKPDKEQKEKPKKIKGENYLKAKTYIDRTKKYSITEAINLVKKTSFTNFDGTVEVHINTIETGIRGTISLPHGTGKSIKVAVASDDLIKEISAGKINFDILIATPEMMPKLAKVAKVLGPKGLMPNPKSGTITKDPKKLIDSLSKGQIQYKTEVKSPIIHSIIGKVSFDNNKLEENLKALIEAVNINKINSLSINPTMGPGVKVDHTSI